MKIHIDLLLGAKTVKHSALVQNEHGTYYYMPTFGLAIYNRSRMYGFAGPRTRFWVFKFIRELIRFIINYKVYRVSEAVDVELSWQ